MYAVDSVIVYCNIVWVLTGIPFTPVSGIPLKEYARFSEAKNLEYRFTKKATKKTGIPGGNL